MPILEAKAFRRPVNASLLRLVIGSSARYMFRQGGMRSLEGEYKTHAAVSLVGDPAAGPSAKPM